MSKIFPTLVTLEQNVLYYVKKERKEKEVKNGFSFRGVMVMNDVRVGTN